MWNPFTAIKADGYELRKLVELVRSVNLNFNPFERVIVTPVVASRHLIDAVSELRRRSDIQVVMFDSGGYQVQCGYIESFEKLCVRLANVWRRYDWADYFVLPDHVPKTKDSDEEVARKVRDTLLAGERFLKLLRHGEPIGVVHGRSVVQVIKGVRWWHSLGVRYVAFGSFETAGRDESVNCVSSRSMVVLRALTEEALSLGMKVHVFGLGGPTSLEKVFLAAPFVESFDSAGWRKAAGFHEVFFGFRIKQRLRTPKAITNRLVLNDEMLRAVKAFAGHDCPFCQSVTQLENFHYRSLHNLVVVWEMARALEAQTNAMNGGALAHGDQDRPENRKVAAAVGRRRV
jgi:hypothetical protein